MSIFLQTLSQANVIHVRQKFGIAKIAKIFGFETRNHYRIQTDDGQEFGYCAELKLGNADTIRRQLLGHWRNFNIVGTDIENQQVFRAHHPFRWIFQRLDVFGADDRPVGSLQQRFAWLNKKVEFLDTRGRVIMTMTTPLWKIWTFPIKKGEREVSIIEKKWSGFSKATVRTVFKSQRKNRVLAHPQKTVQTVAKELFTDAHNFRVHFTDTKLTADETLLLLTGAVFVDVIYTADLRLLLMASAAPEAIILFHVIRGLLGSL